MRSLILSLAAFCAVLTCAAARGAAEFWRTVNEAWGEVEELGETRVKL